MSRIWFYLMVAGTLLLLATNPSGFILSLTNAGNKAITFSLTLAGIFCIWMGFFKIMENAGILEIIKKPLKPIIKFIFGKVDNKSEEYLATMLSADVMGVSGVGTASGILATHNLVGDKEVITYAAAMLVVLNASSIQIFPSTIISMRAAAGSTNPPSILLPALIASFATTIFSVLLMKLFWRLFPPKNVKL
ncbi:MAG: spore maturation protein [Firmicutes bacterium]|nr:spore maturation protein [Bacillota bacterium]